MESEQQIISDGSPSTNDSAPILNLKKQINTSLKSSDSPSSEKPPVQLISGGGVGGGGVQIDRKQLLTNLEDHISSKYSDSVVQPNKSGEN